MYYYYTYVCLYKKSFERLLSENKLLTSWKDLYLHFTAEFKIVTHDLN